MLSREERIALWSDYMAHAIASPHAKEHKCCIGCFARDFANGALRQTVLQDMQGFFDPGEIEKEFGEEDGILVVEDLFPKKEEKPS